jgi:rhodanese-related sulfurtransferase
MITISDRTVDHLAIARRNVTIVVCQEGYTSSLAAAGLQDLGLRRATDLAGGFAAWAAAGLPVQHPTTPERAQS